MKKDRGMMINGGIRDEGRVIAQVERTFRKASGRDQELHAGEKADVSFGAERSRLLREMDFQHLQLQYKC